jgi:hypothetical protein
MDKTKPSPKAEPAVGRADKTPEGRAAGDANAKREQRRIRIDLMPSHLRYLSAGHPLEARFGDLIVELMPLRP